MAFTSLNASDLDVGDPVKKEIFDQIKTNEDDADARITTLEGTSGKVEVFNGIIANLKHYSTSGTLTGIAHYRAMADFNLAQASILVPTAGSAGNFEIDILKSSTIDGTYVSIFASTPDRPNLSYTAGNGAEDAGTIGTTSVSQNDFLRLDITAFQTGSGTLYVNVYGA